MLKPHVPATQIFREPIRGVFQLYDVPQNAAGDLVAIVPTGSDYPAVTYLFVVTDEDAFAKKLKEAQDERGAAYRDLAKMREEQAKLKERIRELEEQNREDDESFSRLSGKLHDMEKKLEGELVKIWGSKAYNAIVSAAKSKA